MIVCLCKAKTDRDVLQAIDDGAASLRDLQRCGRLGQSLCTDSADGDAETD